MNILATRVNAVILCLVVLGHSAWSGESAVAAEPKAVGHVQIDGNIAVLVFAKSGRKYKLGTVTGDQVKLYNGWGGTTTTLKELEATFAKYLVEVENDYRIEQRALFDALSTSKLIGIWVQEEVKVNGQSQPLDQKKPDYLILRDDKSNCQILCSEFLNQAAISSCRSPSLKDRPSRTSVIFS